MKRTLFIFYKRIVLWKKAVSAKTCSSYKALREKKQMIN